jgi:hypothetical protein
VSKAGARKPTGTIAITGQETARYSQFATCLAQLRHPGWKIQAHFGYDTAYARHRAVETFEGDYLFFLDDDHVFQRDLLERLLRHKVDIVAPLYVKRGQGFRPVAYSLDGERLKLGEPGLVEVGYTGTSGMLIHRRVFDVMDPPFFRAGQVAPHMVAEDVDFCQRAREHGFQVWCDTQVQFGHLACATLSPAFVDGRWVCAVAVGDTLIPVPMED